MKAQGNEMVWILAYIDSSFTGVVNEQLGKYPEYSEVESFIPTVKVLKKTFKGKQEFVEVPLLFQYGFFKVPRKLAIHPSFLETLQRRVNCIYGWVKDPAKNGTSGVAIVEPEAIAEMVKASASVGVHSAEELDSLKPGDFIRLQGYPYDGVGAEFIKKDDKKRLVKVRIILFEQNMEVEVSFENVYFTVYQKGAYEEGKLGENSLDEMVEKRTAEKVYKKMYKDA